MFIPPSPEAEYQPELSAKVGLTVFSCKMKHAGVAHPWPPVSVTLRPDECEILLNPVKGRRLASALFVLCHEMGHVLVPTQNELRANLYAVVHFKLVGLRLGLTRAQARRIWLLSPY